MAKCEYCLKDMLRAKGCNRHYFILPNKEKVLAPRVGIDDKHLPDQSCHDCGAKYGGFHHPGCDIELCPRCDGQLIFGCKCYTHIEMDKKLGLIKIV